MAGIEEVLERLVTDPDFRARLETEPATALAGYQLGEQDMRLLAAQLSADAGATGAVEQRTNKSALAGVLSGLAEHVGGAFDGDATPGGTADPADPAAAAPDGHEEEIEVYGVEYQM